MSITMDNKESQRNAVKKFIERVSDININEETKNKIMQMYDTMNENSIYISLFARTAFDLLGYNNLKFSYKIPKKHIIDIVLDELNWSFDDIKNLPQKKNKLVDELKTTITNFSLNKFFPLDGGNNFANILADYSFNDLDEVFN